MVSVKGVPGDESIRKHKRRATRGVYFHLVVMLLSIALSHWLGAATLPTGFTETQIAASFGGSPTAMSFAPDGRLFVCVKEGTLRVVKNGALLATPFLSLTVDSNGERGLLGVAFDPNFSTNHYVYVYYTSNVAPVHNRVSRFVANGDVAVANSETVILDLNNLSSATNHNGGAIHFGPDGKLYIGVGENANGANSQTLTNLLGKLLRINADGSIPTDNPFYASATGVNRAIWALGLRNPFTFAFQPGTGRIFINDVGQSTWEEINDGIAGSNYGWPTVEGPSSNPNFRSPLFAYGHGSTSTTGCAIVGGAFYNPSTNQFPASYLGKYFFADLCSGWIRLFDPAAGTASDFATGISSPVDLQVGPEGNLYYLSQGSGLYKISALASQPLNISTRAGVGAGDNVTIAGFIINGSGAKRLLVRALGPSVAIPNGSQKLADPTLELRRSDGTLVAANDNWKETQQAEIQGTQLAPTSDAEAAIVASVPAGNYTGIMAGKNGTSGIGLVEVYDLDQAAGSRFANISTRSVVGSGNNVLIGGFILGSNAGAAKVVVRGLGPSLSQAGVANPLVDPTIELHNADGTLAASNDNWQDDATQAEQLTALGLAPMSNLESALEVSLPLGNYTAIVAGKNGGAGVGLVEVYNLP